MTAKFSIKLLRGQEERSSFPLIDETDFVDEPVFSRDSFLSTINDIKVQYIIRKIED